MDDETPIYRILLLERSGAEENDLGFPDTGCIADMGFFYDLEDAVIAMHNNSADIRECVYDYGFILIQKPGLYPGVGKESRIYFKWDDERKGFYESEEPKLLGMIAY